MAKAKQLLTVHSIDATLQLLDLCQRWVLAACAQDVPEVADDYAPSATLVVERKSLAEVCRCLHKLSDKCFQQ